MEITKAVVLAGGLGTRMAPITKVIAKEMLPIVDKPLLAYLVEDLISAGIKEILIVSHKEKGIIQNYFQNGKISFCYAYPNGANGVVDAIMHAKNFVGDSPFVLLFGDVLFYSKKNSIKEIINLYNKTGLCVVSAMQVENSEQNLYGIVELKRGTSFSYIYNIIEKPKKGETKSLVAISGQYVLDSKIFEIMKNQKNKLFTDALLKLAKENKLILKIIDGKYFDVGSKTGFIKANIFYALKHPETQKSIKKYIKTIIEKELK